MCTALYDENSRLFLRTLDLEGSYGESLAIAARRYRLKFIHEGELCEHYAFFGTAHIADGVPLFYEAANEAGLCVAALSFPENAVYFKKRTGKRNLASFEVIPFLLASCGSVYEARELLLEVNITDDAFSSTLLPTPMHWLVADASGSIVLEQTKEGLCIYENPHSVMTNNPPFPFHMANVENYSALSSSLACRAVSTANGDTDIESNSPPYSNGLGAFGLPGDFSSPSRLVRANFIKKHATRVEKTGNSLLDSESEVVRAFHILDSVSVVHGAVISESGAPFYTVYSSVIDAAGLCYYFTTYRTRQIRCVKITATDISGSELLYYPLAEGECIYYKRPKRAALKSKTS